MLANITNTINNKIQEKNIMKKSNKQLLAKVSNHGQVLNEETIDKAKAKEKDAFSSIDNKKALFNSSSSFAINTIATSKTFIHPCLPQSKENSEEYKILFINRRLKSSKLNPYNSETNRKSDFILNKKRSMTSISEFSSSSTSKYYHSNISFNNKTFHMKIFKEEDVIRHNTLLKSQLILNSDDEDVSSEEETIGLAVKLTLSHLKEAIKAFSSISRSKLKERK